MINLNFNGLLLLKKKHEIVSIETVPFRSNSERKIGFFLRAQLSL